MMDSGVCSLCGEDKLVLNNRGSGAAHEDYMCRPCIEYEIEKYKAYLEEFDEEYHRHLSEKEY